MTREEMLKRRIVRDSETEQAANVYLDGVFGGGKHQDLYVRLFMAGARRADEHPCWQPRDSETGFDTSDSDSWMGSFTAEFEDGECVTIKQNEL